MSRSNVSLTQLGIFIGALATLYGGYKIAKGFDYSAAAEHQATTIGQILHKHTGKGGTSYRCTFTVNGVKVDDVSDVCATPITKNACDENGLAVVYYTFQPSQNSLLQDFSVASKDAFRTGEFALAVGLPLSACLWVAQAMFRRKHGFEDDPDDTEEVSDNDENNEPEETHVVPDR